MTTVSIDHALSLWDETQAGTATLINLSENHTFRVDGPNGRHILRVHRPGYQSRDTIRSELIWLDALRRDVDLPVPRPLPGRDGDLVQHVLLPGEELSRSAVLFVFEEGREPQLSDDLTTLFATLGRFAAIAHGHVCAFKPPAGFSRPIWDAPTILDADGLWGDWRMAPHVAGTIRTTLDALDARLRRDLASYGNSPDRFGLIHADMRLANLLVDGDAVTLIDFDDCGFGWFAYDFAAAVSFFEDSPLVPALKRSWLSGYAGIRRLAPEDIDAVDAMILLRRMALLAWIGSHGETELARQHASDFARVTAEMARNYLS